ncbi:hypothetical protein HON22_00325 [Candidatus Peregrinibacteria bacterium]|jgi:hypothetical protein|nr:hypothetical protein [Candidatus Peregrinibacteria bacterium]
MSQRNPSEVAKVLSALELVLKNERTTEFQDITDNITRAINTLIIKNALTQSNYISVSNRMNSLVKDTLGPYYEIEKNHPIKYDNQEATDSVSTTEYQAWILSSTKTLLDVSIELPEECKKIESEWQLAA